MLRVIVSLVVITFLLACQKENKTFLPKSTGQSGDIVIVMDSMQWKGEVGSAIRKVLGSDVPGLPREEPLFNIINIHPSGNLGLLLQLRNLMFVFSLDQNTKGAKRLVQGFTPQTIQQIEADTSYYIYSEKDVYARDQEVIYLFGKTEELLVHHILNNAQSIRDYLNDIERHRLEEKLLKTKATESISKFLIEEQQCALSIPYGYKVADKQNDFIWFRQIEPEADKDVFITWKSYESEYQLLPDSIVAWRDATAKKYLFEDPDNPVSFIMTEREVPFNPVTAKQLKLNDHYAMEIRGLWRTNNKSMGGPFIGYALVDQQRGLLYYIEGFTFSPGKSQREIVRELETILKTFRTSEDLRKNEGMSK